MNQLVAPTSFITATSRRRAKIAIRMVLRISTEADARSTRAITRMPSCSARVTFRSVFTCFSA